MVPNVERGWSTIGANVVGVGHAARLAARPKERSAVIERLAKRVGAFKKDAMASLVSGRHHHAVVVRVAEILASPDRAEERIREHLLVWGALFKVSGGVPHDYDRLVLVHEQAQLVRVRPLIVHLQRESRP